MSQIMQHDEKMQFVEKIGLTMEESGQPRIAGRIIGWLLICDPPHQSFDDLVEILQASKGSISNMTRLLLQSGLVERYSLPGDRKTYFRIRSGAWRRVLRRQMDVVQELQEIAEEGLALLKNEPGEQRERLQEMHDFYAFIYQRLPALIDEYEEKHETAAVSG